MVATTDAKLPTGTNQSTLSSNTAPAHNFPLPSGKSMQSPLAPMTKKITPLQTRYDMENKATWKTLLFGVLLVGMILAAPHVTLPLIVVMGLILLTTFAFALNNCLELFKNYKNMN